MTDPGKIDASQAVDLDPRKRDAALSAAKAQEEADKRSQLQARLWERAMRRTFKGIFTHRERLHNLRRFYQRTERGDFD